MIYTTNMFNPQIPGYDDCAYGDNVAINNIFYLNSHTIEYIGKKAAPTAQIAFAWNATPEFGRYHNNNIFSGEQDSEVFFFQDAAYENPAGPRNRTIASFQERYPDWATNNIEVDPHFINPDQEDYRLSDSSHCIDMGRALTKARSAGAGTVIEVDDVLYFTDGFGLVDSDIIRIGSERLTVVSVNYDNNTLEVDRQIYWEEGIPVTLDYEGEAPDIGAYEFGKNTSIQPRSICRPTGFVLQNYPNPFNPTTSIQFEIPETIHIKLEIYNIVGQKVIILADEQFSTGVHWIEWNGTDQNNRHLGSGIFISRLSTENQVLTKKMLLVK